MEGYGNENPGAFQPTRPLRGATRLCCGRCRNMDFNPRAPCGARPIRQRETQVWRISTHAPLAGRDFTDTGSFADRFLFQPTRPLRGATFRAESLGLVSLISTHAPLAGRDTPVADAAAAAAVSTHAPLAGRDISCRIAWFGLIDFNPRAPCGARLICHPSFWEPK